MKNIDELKETVIADRKAGKLTRGKAIRYHCIDCMGYQTAEVARCKCKWCPLWEFRMGKETPLPTSKPRGKSKSTAKKHSVLKEKEGA